jgi:hypothetical protein
VRGQLLPRPPRNPSHDPRLRRSRLEVPRALAPGLALPADALAQSPPPTACRVRCVAVGSTPGITAAPVGSTSSLLIAPTTSRDPTPRTSAILVCTKRRTAIAPQAQSARLPQSQTSSHVIAEPDGEPDFCFRSTASQSSSVDLVAPTATVQKAAVRRSPQRSGRGTCRFGWRPSTATSR